MIGATLTRCCPKVSQSRIPCLSRRCWDTSYRQGSWGYIRLLHRDCSSSHPSSQPGVKLSTWTSANPWSLTYLPRPVDPPLHGLCSSNLSFPILPQECLVVIAETVRVACHWTARAKVATLIESLSACSFTGRELNVLGQTSHPIEHRCLYRSATWYSPSWQGTTPQ
jgi:hypothetical protein